MRSQLDRVDSILRIVIPYLFFASIWILASDRAILFISQDSLTLARLQSIKGMAFVMTSGALLFILLLAELRRTENNAQQHRVEITSYIKKLEQHNADLETMHEALIAGWATALELRDLETGGHSKRVTEMVDYLAVYFGFSEANRRVIRWGAILHDIGKMGIPDSILLKPDRLTAEERLVIEKHPTLARQFLASTPFLMPALIIPYYHHERWDGSGYPTGLQGEKIPLEARLFAVVDVADAMAANRPYRKAFSVEEVNAYLEQEAGRKFDARVVKVFIAEDLLRRCLIDQDSSI